MGFRKIFHHIFLLLVFMVFTMFTFFGMQWFSNSLEQFYWHDASKNLFSANIEASAANILSLSSTGDATYPKRLWNIDDVTVNATSAIAVEVGGEYKKTLFSQNENQVLPIASLTKIMTALVVLENYDLNKNVVISKAAMAEEGEQGMLQEGQVLTVKNLLYISLIESSNRAAYALAEQIGVEKFIGLMNAKAQELGLSSTYFNDVSGLDTASRSNVKDLVVLSEYTFSHQSLFLDIVNLQSFDLYLSDGSLHHTLVNTDQLLGERNVIGGKTGWTTAARGCLMLIEQGKKDGHYIIYVVLGANDRFKEMENIIDWVRTAYQW